MEVSGFLVVPAVFKTDVADSVGQAGSIPVRLRQSRSGRCAVRENESGPAAQGATCARPP
jgi:hypothetical protein